MATSRRMKLFTTYEGQSIKGGIVLIFKNVIESYPAKRLQSKIQYFLSIFWILIHLKKSFKLKNSRT